MRTLSSFFGSGGDLIQPPQTVEKIVPPTRPNCLPTLENDGSRIELPIHYDTGYIRKYTAANNTEWTVNIANIDASGNFWSPIFWYDNVESVLYVITCRNTGTYNTLAKIPNTGGTPTIVGTFTTDIGIYQVNQLHKVFTSRAVHGSGNLIVRKEENEYEISTANGQIVSGPTALSQDGIPLSSIITTTGYIYPQYETAAKDLYIIKIPSHYSVNHQQRQGLGVMRGGSAGVYLPPDHHHIGSDEEASGFILWDDYVALTTACINTTGLYPAVGPRFFNRVDFDRYLHDIADFLGLPAA